MRHFGIVQLMTSIYNTDDSFSRKCNALIWQTERETERAFYGFLSQAFAVGSKLASDKHRQRPKVI